jgi:cell division protein FtsB
LNRVANFSAAELSVHAVTRRRARTGTSSLRIVDGVLVMILLAAVGICFSFYRQMRAELEAARTEHSRMAAEADAARVENDRIAAEIDALHTDPDVVESAARQQLGMVRPGEVVASISRPAGRR